jgi:UDP-3-O-[3-hydroxymyristoyl] glucosamine N-acyltransferase
LALDKLLTLARLADLLDGVWYGDAQHAIIGISSLFRATGGELAYFDPLMPVAALRHTKAGIVLLKADSLAESPTNSIVVASPKEAIIEVAKHLSSSAPPTSLICPTAFIHPSARVGEGVSIGSHAVIGEGVSLGMGTSIGAHCIIDSSVSIGEECIFASGVILHSGSLIGNNVVINSGSIVGASPFNYLKIHGVWQQGPSMGGVTIADNVHIGANSVIDKGSIGDTYLAQGVCIDNLVHIAHDVSIGANTIIAGCAVIGAYTVIETDCIIGGASCIAASVHLASDVVISGMSTVSKSIVKPGIYSSGTTAHEHERWRRNVARFRRLDDYINRLGALERKLSSEPT